ncbi:MAG TPA: hypothetical protein VH144_03375 [Candidatus Saccharimonadales bacterium]|jgi:hypothetical protein|nr:hypothetical protein [Candidatus Saccharimonadales bacterium]
MAELSYSDTTRAAQEGTRDIWNLLQRLQQQVQQMGNVQQSVTQINYIYQQLLPDFLRQLQALNIQTDQITRKMLASSNTDQRIITMQQDLNELKQRFNTFERFAQDMSNYFHQQTRRQEQEDQNSL